jgi:hypothetical protein
MATVDLEAAIKTYLQPGENIRWMGRPAQGLRMSAGDSLKIPISLLWGGFLIFVGVSTVSSGDAGWPSLIPATPVTLVVLYFIAGRFFVDSWVRSRTIYALTERRALMLRTVFSERLVAANLDGNVRIIGEREGRGTLDFWSRASVSPFTLSRTGFGFTPALSSNPCFIGIADVRRVYQLAKASSLA